MRKEKKEKLTNTTALKSILTTLISLMLVSTFAGGLLPAIVQAEPPTITLWGVRTADPFWGYYGGYHDMWAAIKPELLKIGIDLKIETFDAWTFEAIFYDDWNISGDPNNDGIRDGWDLAMREWRLNPTSHVWFDEMVLADHVPEWNVSPMMNEVADYLYREALSSINDPARYKRLMWRWQELFMHDPVFAAVYYAEMMTARGAYLDGYDDASWLYGCREVNINQDVFDAVAPASRKAVGGDTWIWGAVEAVDETHPYGTSYYTEEALSCMRFGMLYRGEREHNNFTYDPEARGAARVHPDVAADFLTWYNASDIYPGEYDAGMFVARMPIRTGMYWSDGVECNATDVAFTYTAVLDSDAGSSSRYDYINMIKEVRVNATYIADFILYEPRYDFAAYLAHMWGKAIIPWHQMKDVPFSTWKSHPSNDDWKPVSMGGDGLECLGPYVPVATDYPVTTFVEYERFDLATGQPWWWNKTASGTEGWGAELPERVIMKIMPDAADRLIALQTLTIDFAEYPTAPIETYQAMEDWPTHKVYRYKYPASNPLWFNLNSPILSNRYVRLAIAHAIPYPEIFTEILPGWGVGKVIPGRTFILPQHDSYHPDLPAYEYDLEKAQKYMDMYWNSLDKTTLPGNDAQAVVDNSPMGDADHSGYVDLTDFLLWRARVGTTPSTYEHYPAPYPEPIPYDFPEVTLYLPGNDVDPDFDNKDDVDTLNDLPLWADNFGTEYPFPGAW